MRRIINSTYITLDGAVEGPHLWPSLGDAASEVSDDIQNELLTGCDALLMGRRTYESFAAVWPARAGDPVSDRINRMRKYVASSTLQDPTWNNTTVISRNLVPTIARLKQEPGLNIVQYGLGPVAFALLEHGLLDEIRLWVHPLILGRNGPLLPHFHDAPPTGLELTASKTLPNGIALLSYEVKRS
jgi:dihydrofolate reductase